MSEKVFDGGLLPQQSIAIGIDQSLTGFAMAAVDMVRPDQYEIWVYKSPYSGVERLVDIHDWIRQKLWFLEEDQGNFIEHTAMEGSVLASFSALKLGELAATVKLCLYSYFKPYNEIAASPLQVPPMTLKKYVAGKGNAKKQEMLLQTYKRWGIELNDDNAADAYGLARLAAGHAISPIEEQIVAQIKDPKYRDQINF